MGTSSSEDEVPGSRFSLFSEFITFPFSWVSFCNSLAILIADSILIVNSVLLSGSISSMASCFLFFCHSAWILLVSGKNSVEHSSAFAGVLFGIVDNGYAVSGKFKIGSKLFLFLRIGGGSGSLSVSSHLLFPLYSGRFWARWVSTRRRIRRLLTVLLSSSADVDALDLDLERVGVWGFEVGGLAGAILELNPFLVWTLGLFLDLDSEVFEASFGRFSFRLLAWLVGIGSNLTGYFLHLISSSNFLRLGFLIGNRRWYLICLVCI